MAENTHVDVKTLSFERAIEELESIVKRLEDGKVVLPAGLKPGANVRPAGEDIPSGHAALLAGQRLRPQDVALAAAFGLTQLDVVRRIRVAVFSTGDELVSPGENRAAAQLFDSNRFMLMAMLNRQGCEVSDLGILRARVCDLSSLVLSRRHASIYNEAVQAFREQWSAEEPEEPSRDESGNAFQLNKSDSSPDADHSE